MWRGRAGRSEVIAPVVSGGGVRRLCLGGFESGVVSRQEGAVMNNWYVVHCKPFSDKEAMENLIRQGYEVYRPTITRTIRRGRSNVVELHSMFPRYLFIRGAAPIINSMAVNSTRGVERLVAFAGVNGVVTDMDVERIKSLEDDSRVHMPKLRADAARKLTFSGFSDIPRDVLSWNEQQRSLFLLNAMRAKMNGTNGAMRNRARAS